MDQLSLFPLLPPLPPDPQREAEIRAADRRKRHAEAQRRYYNKNKARAAFLSRQQSILD